MIYYMIFVSIAAGTYFSLLWRITGKTNTSVEGYAGNFKAMVSNMNLVVQIIKKFDERFLNLETEIRLQKSDSSRLTEWLAKEEVRRQELNSEIIKSLKNDEREKRVLELARRFGDVIKK